MANLFDTFSLANRFSVDQTELNLRRVSTSISSGNATFDRVLLNDDDIRERTKTHKDGVDYDRERISALIGKVQTLQGRLQAMYQGMMDRLMAGNSGEMGTPQQNDDVWPSGEWRVAGSPLPLPYSRAGHADTTITDPYAREPNDLGREHFWRPVQQNTAGGVTTAYEERGGYYTTLSYLNTFDLHTLNSTYATGSAPAEASPASDISKDMKIQLSQVDYAKTKTRNWKKGDVIPLVTADIFTPEFMATPYGAKYGTIQYMNGSGYQYPVPTPALYAYVRDVEYLPDGLTKPTAVDMLTSLPPVDADGDGIPDNIVKLNDYLRNITIEHHNFDLSDPGGSNNNNINNWIPDTPQEYHFSDNPWFGYSGGNGFGGSVWAGTHYQGSGFWGGASSGQWGDVDATFRNTFTIGSGNQDPLRHPVFAYSTAAFGTTVDDYGELSFNDGNTGWNQLQVDSAGGASTNASGGTIQSMGLRTTNTSQFAVHGYNRKAEKIWRGISFPTTPPWPDRTAHEPYGGGWDDSPSGVGWPFYEFWDPTGYYRDGGAGIEVANANWDIDVLKDESAPGKNDGDQDKMGTNRYTIDRYGNIFDKFGKGDGKPDDYDYIPDLVYNAKMNYVGNIFGLKDRIGNVTKMDANGNNMFDAAEAKPVLQFSERDFNKKDEAITLPTPGQNISFAPFDPVAWDPGTAGTGSFGVTTLDTFNPMFADKFIGFSESDHTSIGSGGLNLDAFGQPLNTMTVHPFRTQTALTSQYLATAGATIIDRDYAAIPLNTIVNITDSSGNVVDGAAKLGAYSAIDGTYTIIPSVTLQAGKTYNVTTVPIPDVRTGGTQENGFANVVNSILKGNEYKEVMKDGLLEDLQLSASATDAFGGSISAKLTLHYNKHQERVELFQNSWAAFYKSGA